MANTSKKKVTKVSVTKKKKLMFVASEGAPFIATGGLADVIGSLPKSIAKNGNYDVSVVMPLYSSIKQEYRKDFKFIKNFEVSVAWRRQYCGVFYYEYEGVKFYFIDNESYFKRDGNIYGFYDDGERFAFFSRAVLDTIYQLDLYPDVIHCNDWHTAAVIIYLKSIYAGDEKFRNIKTVFTIHNIEYQGVYGFEIFGDLFGFPNSARQYVEYNGCINLMKGAIEMSDYVNTVSPTYAEEIKNAYYAHGLEPIIWRNSHKLCGILNGIDIDYYNPATDPYLFANYTPTDRAGKAVCKRELQKMLGLPVKDVPIVGIISRLVSHKGLDLVKGVIDSILADDIQLVILGKGDTSYENFFSHIASAYPSKCVAIIAYNQDMSRKIYSGADILLMPSKTEPCGLSQMIASRYGTVPIVRETGGLNDSIKAYTGENGNGFTFKDYNAHDMLYVINQACRLFYNKDAWEDLKYRIMNVDFSWQYQSTKYEELYNRMF